MRQVAPFVMVDIETLGVISECGSSFIVTPSAAFVVWKGWEVPPDVLTINFNTNYQLSRGAKVSPRTIAFWMEEAAKGNPAAKTIIKTLADLKGDEVFTSLDDESLAASKSSIELLGKFLALLSIENVEFYGNGPEFDLTILESVISSVYPRDSVPWKFWNAASARELKNLYKASGKYYKVLQAESYEYASSYMLETCDTYIGSADKHDPLFDALAESYVVAKIKEFFLNK